jgi:hypothetical protein
LDFTIAEPQDPKPFGLQPSITLRIVDRIMERPIRLDREAMAQADKIQDVGAHRHLTAELQACESPLTQSIPEKARSVALGLPRSRRARLIVASRSMAQLSI